MKKRKKIISREIYKIETGKEPIFNNGLDEQCTNNYLKWLEQKLNNYYEIDYIKSLQIKLI
jgi:hypothetical protein